MAKHHHPKRHGRHKRILLVFFARIERIEEKLCWEDNVSANLQLVANLLTSGFALTLAESAAGAPLPLSKGPFTVAVADPNNTVTHTPGSADQTTPDTFFPNGTGNTGIVTVTVTDTSVTPNALVGVGSFQVVAPAPPPPPPTQPDTLTVGFTPITAPAASSTSTTASSTTTATGASPAAATSNLKKAIGETGEHGETGELGTNKP